MMQFNVFIFFALWYTQKILSCLRKDKHEIVYRLIKLGELEENILTERKMIVRNNCKIRRIKK